MRTLLVLGLTLSVIGCGPEPSAIDAEIDAFNRETKERALKACGISEDEIPHPDTEGDETAGCYFELGLEVGACGRDALSAHPKEARALMACASRDLEALAVCCGRDGDCTYSSVEDCYEELWDGERAGPCDADSSAIDAEIDECYEAQSQENANEMPEPCALADVVPVTWNRAESSHPAPAEVFEGLAGSCSANYELFLSTANESYESSVGEARGTLHITVELDRDSARRVAPTRLAPDCSPRVEVDAHVRIESDDGLLREAADTVLTHDLDLPNLDFGHSVAVPADALGGSLQLSSLESGALILRFAINSVDTSCEGRISLEFLEEPNEDGAYSGWDGPAGSWSGD